MLINPGFLLPWLAPGIDQGLWLRPGKNTTSSIAGPEQMNPKAGFPDT
jgi:hypothetical protein